MIISGQLITRLSKKYKNLIGKTGKVYAVSSVTIAPGEYSRCPYSVCVVEFDDGGKGEFQVVAGEKLNIDDQVKVVLRFGFEDTRGLRFYLPKVTKL